MLTFFGGRHGNLNMNLGTKMLATQKIQQQVSFEKTSFDCFQKMGVEPKIGGILPQNGWFISWFQTLWTNGWFGGKNPQKSHFLHPGSWSQRVETYPESHGWVGWRCFSRLPFSGPGRQNFRGHLLLNFQGGYLGISSVFKLRSIAPMVAILMALKRLSDVLLKAGLSEEVFGRHQAKQHLNWHTKKAWRMLGFEELKNSWVF